MNRKQAVAAWNCAVQQEPIGVDCDNDVVSPFTTFGVVALTHLPSQGLLLSPAIPISATNSFVRNSEVVSFLREIADALEGKNGN